MLLTAESRMRTAEKESIMAQMWWKSFSLTFQGLMDSMQLIPSLRRMLSSWPQWVTIQSDWVFYGLELSQLRANSTKPILTKSKKSSSSLGKLEYILFWICIRMCGVGNSAVKESQIGLPKRTTKISGIWLSHGLLMTLMRLMKMNIHLENHAENTHGLNITLLKRSAQQ